MANSDLPKPPPTTATIPVRKRERQRDLHKLRAMGHVGTSFCVPKFQWSLFFASCKQVQAESVTDFFGKISGMDLNVINGAERTRDSKLKA